MLDSMTFGDILTVLSILGGIGVLLLKLGRKDAQFEAALTRLETITLRVSQHDGDFDALRAIVADLSKMQSVTDTSTRYHQDQLKELRARIAAVENKRGVLES